MIVALVGNLSDGFKCVGPFIDMESACAVLDGMESWLMTVEKPYCPKCSIQDNDGWGYCYYCGKRISA